MELKWWQKPVRMMRRDFLGDFSRYKDLDLETFAREAKHRWHINCEWIMATPGCAPGLAYMTTFNSAEFEKAPGLGDFDILREYLPHARKHGIRVVPYINAHWYSYEFAESHPGWEQLLEDGTSYGRKHPLYGGGTTFCLNSPWRDWIFRLIREVIAIGVDGCFLDGPSICPNACYCEHCRRLYEKATGQKRLPKYMDWADPDWKRFAQFRRDSRANFIRDARTEVESVNPDAVIFLNGGGFSSANIGGGGDVYKFQEHQHFTGAEEFYHVSEEYRSPFRSLNLGRFLSAGDNPSVVFTHHTMSAWHYIPLCKSEMQLALSETVASGANVWFAIFEEAMKHRAEEAYAATEKMCEFLEKHEQFYTDTESAAETAALLSNSTLYYYISAQNALYKDVGSGKEENLTVDMGTGKEAEHIAERRSTSAAILDREYSGCLDALTRSHVPVKVLWDEHLMEEKLKGVKILVLPNTACLSQKQLTRIEQFVTDGGSLIATFESGFYDELGDARRRARWKKFLGIAKVEGAFAPSAVEDYMAITGGKIDGFRDGTILPRTYNALKVKPAAGSETLIRFMNPIGKSYLPMAGDSPYPAVLLSRRGKGRVVYVAAPLFESVHRFGLEDHLRLAQSLVRLASGRRGLQVQTDGPGSLAVEMRKNAKGVLLHLVNATGDMKRPIEKFVALHNVSFSVRAGRIKRIRALVAGKNVRFKTDKGRVAFSIPRIDDYEVLVLER